MQRNGVKSLNKFMSYDPLNTKNTFLTKSLSRLVFEALLFKLSSYDIITRTASSILRSNQLGKPFRYIFKKTIFTHFCGGESFAQCYESIDSMQENFNVSTILDHSTEELHCADALNVNLTNKINLVNEAADFNKKAGHNVIQFIPLKCTALIESQVLENITSIRASMTANNDLSSIVPSDEVILSLLSDNDRKLFQSGVVRFQTICTTARRAQISLLLDAEQSYRQPAIELLYRLLAAEFNSINNEAGIPVLYNTYQAYLSRTEVAIKQDIDHSIAHKYQWAAKVVRGAYLNAEITRSLGMNLIPPTLTTKQATDKSYDGIVDMLLKRITSSANDNSDKKSSISVLFATHNGESIRKAIELMEKQNIDKGTNVVHFAQIKGMCDNVTNALGLAGFNSHKLITFGSFEDLLPWLLRRLEENQDCLAGMQQERHLLSSEIKRRLLSFVKS